MVGLFQLLYKMIGLVIGRQFQHITKRPKQNTNIFLQRLGVSYLNSTTLGFCRRRRRRRRDHRQTDTDDPGCDLLLLCGQSDMVLCRTHDSERQARKQLVPYVLPSV